MILQLTFPQLLGNYCLYLMQLFHRIEKEDEFYLRRPKVNLNADSEIGAILPFIHFGTVQIFHMKKKIWKKVWG